jgi:hypothetical protein
MASSQNLYNNISPDDLRFLLDNVDVFNEEAANFSDWLKGVDHKPFMESLPELSWAHLYEKNYNESINDFFTESMLTHERDKLSASENKIQATLSFQSNLDQNLDLVSSSLPKHQQLDYAASMMCYGIFMMKNARSLMIYGRYINELISSARTGESQDVRDEALLSAIRMDASVVGCQVALVRISKAVLLDDVAFLKNFRNAVEGKLGELEAQNFQKIRFILQVLHESGGITLSNVELKELFVEQLNLYSDSQYSAAKNLGELTRKFKKKKSTI